MLDSALEWVNSLIGEAISAVVSAFMIMLDSLSLSSVKTYFPALAIFYNIIFVVAAALLLLFVSFQALRSFGVMGFEAENPVQLIGRCVSAVVIMPFSFKIVSALYEMCMVPYAWLREASQNEHGPDLMTVFTDLMQDGAIGTMFTGATSSGVKLLLSCIFLGFIGWNIVKLCLEAVERFAVVAVLAYTSPLGFAMMGTKATSGIFQKWCRMLGGQLFLLIINAWSLGVLCSALKSPSNDLLWYILVFSFLKVAQNADSLLQRLGIEVTTTGGSMMEELFATASSFGGAIKGGVNAGMAMMGGASTAGGIGAAVAGAASLAGVSPNTMQPVMSNLHNAQAARNAIHVSPTAGSSKTAAASSMGSADATGSPETTSGAAGPVDTTNAAGFANPGNAGAVGAAGVAGAGAAGFAGAVGSMGYSKIPSSQLRSNFMGATKGLHGGSGVMSTDMAAGGVRIEGQSGNSFGVIATDAEGMSRAATVMPTSDFNANYESLRDVKSETFDTKNGSMTIVDDASLASSMATEQSFQQAVSAQQSGGCYTGEISEPLNQRLVEQYGLKRGTQVERIVDGEIQVKAPPKVSVIERPKVL